VVQLFLLSMHKLCGQRTTDGRYKCATKGAIWIGHCTTPSIGLGRGRAVPDPGQGAGAQRGRARSAVAGDRGDAPGFASVDEHVTALERAKMALDS